MDETLVWFDMLTSKTVVLVKTTGHEKLRFTIVLACMSDGTKLKIEDTKQQAVMMKLV